MYYCTKYALTQGIWEVPDEQVKIGETNGDYIYVKPANEHGFSSMGIQFRKGEYFRSEAEAQAKFHNMVEAKIRTLEKQMAKLTKMASAPVKIIKIEYPPCS